MKTAAERDHARLTALYTQSGLRQAELAILWGVSRLMVNRYLQGKAHPSVATQYTMERTNAVLNRMLAQERLPLSADYDKERRANAIKKIKEFVAALPD